MRLAREKGKAEAMEDWLFANQPTLTPATGEAGARATSAASPTSTRATPSTLTLVKADIAQGGQLKVHGTPTFFMNGMRLPGLRPEFLDAAIAWR